MNSETRDLPFRFAPAGEPGEAVNRFRKLCWDGFLERFGAGPEGAGARERLAGEIHAIERLGYVSLFLALEAVVRWCRENGVLTGPNRGAIEGSLAARALGVTRLDPLEHGLVFERFLGPDTKAPPYAGLDLAAGGLDRAVERLRRVPGLEECGGDRSGSFELTLTGLPALDRLQEAVERACGRPAAEVAEEVVPLDDERTWDRIGGGEARFLLYPDEFGFLEILPIARPRELRDLAALFSLCRPGPTAEGHLEAYLESMKRNAEVCDLPAPCGEVLAGSRGALIYQEDCMRVANRVAGFDMARADRLRKAIIKRKAEQVQALRIEFVDGAKAGGMKAEEAHAAFAAIERALPFSFMKAHAVSQCRFFYWTAFLEANRGVRL
ncbi:MAG: hypothetical protein MUC63_04005 [Planctomycetes bacterium]|nr:hypothetical protein [Planctomycetota bacterium]